MIDDGTAEDAVGDDNISFVACNSFPVTGGNNVITSISIAWGTPASSQIPLWMDCLTLRYCGAIQMATAHPLTPWYWRWLPE